MDIYVSRKSIDSIGAKLLSLYKTQIQGKGGRQPNFDVTLHLPHGMLARHYQRIYQRR